MDTHMHTTTALVRPSPIFGFRDEKNCVKLPETIVKYMSTCSNDEYVLKLCWKFLFEDFLQTFKLEMKNLFEPESPDRYHRNVTK